ncbi:MAG: hypothetical protein EHM58_03295 [Ignavibacteriae bacterium]|nr:MAG: hypothetical protein EHM58_03295 [Ignavibacteriota bacterium]
MIKIYLFSVLLTDITTFSQQTGSDMDTYTQSAAIGALVMIVIMFIIILYLSGVVTKEEITERPLEVVGNPALRSREKMFNAFRPTIARIYFVLLILVFINILILILILFS